MLKLTVDWCDETRDPRDIEFDGVVVELVEEHGPGGGWPVFMVLVPGESTVAGPLLWAWLREVYGSDEDEASELASFADYVA